MDYRDLHLDVHGPETGAPVLLLHGWGSNAQLMRPVADALTDRLSHALVSVTFIPDEAPKTRA